MYIQLEADFAESWMSLPTYLPSWNYERFAVERLISAQQKDSYGSIGQI